MLIEPSKVKTAELEQLLEEYEATVRFKQKVR
jgi:hypothetical protein